MAFYKVVILEKQ